MRRQESTEDTICAVSTPPGIGGIGIIRVSGPDAGPVLQRFFRRRPGAGPAGSPSPRRVRYGFLVDGNGRVLDEVLATFLPAPRTYTRQDMVEIGCHGGYASLVGVVRALVASGCRLAGPGEFTRRAYLSGRIDLAQAQATLAVITSRTEEERRAAISQLRGGISRPLEKIAGRLTALLARINAGIDFPEETAGDCERENHGGEIVRIREALGELAAGARQGEVFSRGIATGIVGFPNVGKSSLLNALLADERAIVSDTPGTTRDEVSETLVVAGYPLKLIDTAGIRRAPGGSVEAQGVRRSMERLSRADLVLLVLDRSRPLAQDEKRLLEDADPARTVLVLNKQDLPAAFSLPPGLPDPSSPSRAGRFHRVSVSALSGAGLETLRKTLGELVVSGQVFPRSGEPVFLALKQKQLLSEALAETERAGEIVHSGQPLEFAASALARAAHSLAEMTGRDAGEDLLESIFSSFCIGK